MRMVEGRRRVDWNPENFSLSSNLQFYKHQLLLKVGLTVALGWTNFSPNFAKDSLSSTSTRITALIAWYVFIPVHRFPRTRGNRILDSLLHHSLKPHTTPAVPQQPASLEACSFVCIFFF